MPILCKSSSGKPAFWATSSTRLSALSTLSSVESRNCSTVPASPPVFFPICKLASGVAKLKRYNNLPVEGKSRVGVRVRNFGALLISQRNHRIHLSGAARGNVGCEERNCQQHQGHLNISQGVTGLDAVQHGRHVTGQPESPCQAGRQADRYQ